MTFRQALLIPALGLPLLSSIALGVSGNGWIYFFLLLSMLICFIVAELVSIKKRGRTISKDIGNAPKWVFWLVTGSFLFLGVGMAIHWILYL